LANVSFHSPGSLAGYRRTTRPIGAGFPLAVMSFAGKEQAAWFRQVIIAAGPWLKENAGKVTLINRSGASVQVCNKGIPIRISVPPSGGLSICIVNSVP
jgi:hypothetical protein